MGFLVDKHFFELNTNGITDSELSFLTRVYWGVFSFTCVCCASFVIVSSSSSSSSSSSCTREASEFLGVGDF